MIFIDPPYWPAHGTVFSHLISDTSVAELHNFAAANGVAERAFDLDHYDVPERIYDELVAAGATPLSGKDLARTLAASGLRIKAKYRVKSVGSVLERRWNALMPGHPELGAQLRTRWSEPHRHYHSGTHLLAVLEALDALSQPNVPRPVALAAWFHDAVYKGAPTDELESADLAQVCLQGLLPHAEVTEVARLVRLTATHSPSPEDDSGHLLCDADLAILGAPPAQYCRYVAGVRKDHAHVPDELFRQGRATVLAQLLDLDPLFHTAAGRSLWAAQAHVNLNQELAQLNQNMNATPKETNPMTDFTTLPVCEFAFPGPLRDQLVAAVLDGSKTSTTATLIEYAVEQEELPLVGLREAVIDSDGRRVAVIEMTEVRQTRLADVDLQHAIDEGEGFTTVAQWRAGHEEFWHSADMREAMNDPHFTVDDETMLVLQRFKVIARLP